MAPGLNFDYTKFLREQNEKYVKKYGNDAVKAEPNPQPVVGYSGHVPSYRGSIHEMRVVRSLVRCINSPMKPTTATGYRSPSRQFFRPDDEEIAQPKRPENNSKKTPKSPQSAERARSAPVLSMRTGRADGKELPRADPYPVTTSPRPSEISMLSAGSSMRLKPEPQRPKTAQPQVQSIKRPPLPQPQRLSPRTSESARSANSSIPPIRPPVTPIMSKHPTGYPQTLYGASFWYAWPDDVPVPKKQDSVGRLRPDSIDRDRRLTRQDGVIYHRHEGMVPKYMGYVPTYKFRHGSTFGVLTVNATTDSVANKLKVTKRQSVS